MNQLSEMFDRLTGKQCNAANVLSENIQHLQRIVLLEQEIANLHIHIKNIYEQDRQLRLALKSNKILNYKDTKA